MPGVIAKVLGCARADCGAHSRPPCRGCRPPAGGASVRSGGPGSRRETVRIQRATIVTGAGRRGGRTARRLHRRRRTLGEAARRRRAPSAAGSRNPAVIATFGRKVAGHGPSRELFVAWGPRPIFGGSRLLPLARLSRDRRGRNTSP